MRPRFVYADECFVRVYNGTDGDVLFSQYRSSCTWFENPVVADVDGNFRADLVVPSNLACSQGGAGDGLRRLDGCGGWTRSSPAFAAKRPLTASPASAPTASAGARAPRSAARSKTTRSAWRWATRASHLPPG